jgi:hypothetical protein
MRLRIFTLTFLIYLTLSMCLASVAKKSSFSLSQRSSTSSPLVKLSVELQQIAERALARLRVLRDGWNDVNRQYIKPDFEVGGKLSPIDYEVQYLEAKAAVDDALRVLPKGGLRTALEQAMDIFSDLEQLLLIFEKESPLTTRVHVADVFPYLKKYHVPYESGTARGNFGLVIHKDFVMSYILPIRYARVNQVEVLLGGKQQPLPHLQLTNRCSESRNEYQLSTVQESISKN